MRWKQILVPAVNLIVFIGLGVALYELAGGRSAPVTSADENENPPGAATQVQVFIGTIKHMTLHRGLTAYGHVEPAPAAGAQISAPMAALVDQVQCTEGQQVQKGQILFSLDPRAADAQVRSFQVLAAACQAMHDDLAGQKDAPDWLFPIAKWIQHVAESQRDRAIALKSLTTITAPISGIIVRLSIHAGEIASPNSPALEIIDMDHLVLALDIPGFAAGDIKPGQRAWIDAAESHVVRVDPEVDPTSGIASADLEIPPTLSVKPGQFLSARIEVQSQENCLVVPAESVVPDAGGRPRVAFVSDNDHQAIFQFVDLGIREGDWVQILDDSVQEGQEIVTSGAYGLANRSRIVVAGRQ